MNKRLQTLIIALSITFLAAFTANAQNCTVNAGTNTTFCPGIPFVLTGVASGLFAPGTQAEWTQISGPSVTVSATNIVGTAATATVSGYAPETSYTFRLTARCKDGSIVFQDVTHIASGISTANAGPDATLCPGAYVMQGSALGAGETGAWTRVSGSLSTNVATPGDPTTNLVLATNGSVQSATYRWTVTKVTGGVACTTFDDVVITNLGAAPVNAGADINVTTCYNVTTSRQLNGSSAAANAASGQGVLWTFVSGPNTPIISNPAIRNPTVSNLIEGSYIFRYTVTGPCASGSDDVKVDVRSASQNLTDATGGSTQTFCDTRSSFVLTGPKALYAGETVVWTKTAGPGTATFSDATSNVTTVTGLASTPGSSYTFKYTITNSVTSCTSVGTHTVTYTTAPSVVMTGAAISSILITCDAVATTDITFTAAGGAATQYALVSAPAGSTIQTSTFGGTLDNYLNAPASGVSVGGFNVPGTYVLRYRRTANNILGGCQDAYADVTVVASKSPSASNAGTKQVLGCNIYVATLAGNIPASGVGRWSQISGPNTATIANPLLNNTGISGLTNGVYVFRWYISGGNGGCTDSQGDVEVVVAPIVPTAAAAGANNSICNSTPVTLDGNSPALNEVGLWTVLKGGLAAPEATFSSTSAPHAVVNGLLPNTAYTFTWKLSSACGSTQSDVVLTTTALAGPRQATATPDQCLGAAVTSFTLNGLQPTVDETGTWTRVSGPNMPTFTASQYNTNVTGAIPGTYAFEWQLNRNACNPTRDTVYITISAPATVAAAGANQNICGTSVTLGATAVTVGTGTWTQIGGPGGATITTPTQNNTTVTDLTEGRYTFRWTVTNGGCPPTTSDVIINASIQSTTATAGADQDLCNLTSVTLAGNVITNGTGTWGVVSGPNNPTFSSTTVPGPTVTGLIYGTYVFRYTSRGGIFCTPTTDDVQVTVTENANAGSNQSLCALTTTTLIGNPRSTGAWTYVVASGPNTPTVTTSGSNSAIVTGMIAGTYTFRYTLPIVGLCPSTSNDMTVTVFAAPSPALAGPDQFLCLATVPTTINTTMAATAPGVGKGTWTLLDKTVGAPDPVIFDKNVANTAINGMGLGSSVGGVVVYLYEWKVEGTTGPCVGNNGNADIVKITVYKEPSNAVAGPDQLAACSNNVVMNADAITFGLGTWSVVTKPGALVPAFDAINSGTTKITNLETGAYTFRWTVSNGSPTCTSKTSDVNVTVTTAPVTIANAGPATGTTCTTAFPGTASFTLAGSTPDGTETGTWSFVSQPIGSALTAAAFTNVNSTTATIIGLTAGTGAASGVYVLRWTIKNTANQTGTDCQSFDDISITVYNLPSTAVAGTGQNVCLFAPITLGATAVPTAQGIGTWSVFTSAGGTPVFGNVNSPTSSLNGLVAGSYTLRWTVSNGTCTTSTSDVTIVVSDCQIAIAKSTGTPVQQANGSYNITMTFKVRNTGNTALSGVQVVDDLLLTFPLPKTFTKTSLTSSSVSLVVNPSFDGNADKNMLTAGSSSLAVAEEVELTLVVNVTLK